MRTLITGAAGDIGSAIAHTLARSGHSLVLCEHPSAADRLDDVRASCAALGINVSTELFDVADATAARAAVARVTESAPPLDGLVNNAGYQGRFAPIDRASIVDAKRVFDVNVVGAFTMLHVVGQAMVVAGTAGAIVNASSMAGVSGAPNMAAYSASKAAILGLTKSAAKDLAPAGIRVNSVSPAFIGPGKMWDTQVAEQAAANTQYYAPATAEVEQQMIAMVPLRRYGSTTEVANVVAFLLSDNASYLTGINIEIAGGST